MANIALRPVLFCILVFIVNGSVLAQLDSWDSDQDAMPNAWEYYRELHFDNPKDAWKDPDGDGICNVYEYYLGSDPQDPDQPRILEYDGQEPLSSFIRTAPRGSVLRIPEGEYVLNYKHESYGEPPRYLIQGGWNADFTEQDHCKFLTVFNGANKGPIFDFLVATGNSSSLILDGLTLINGKNSAVRYISYVPKTQLMLANTTVVSNSASRTSAVIDYEDGDFTLISDLILINSIVADNQGTGLLVVQRANLSNLKVLHTVIGYNRPATNDELPHDSGYGMVFMPEADSAVHVQMANSILWGNYLADVWLYDKEQKPVVVNSRFNVYGYVKKEHPSDAFNDPSDTGLDPVLIRQSGQYYLGPGSPAKGSGESVGFSEKENPDVGIITCGDPLTTSVFERERLVDRLLVFPNPSGQWTNLTFEWNDAGHLRAEVFDPLGRWVHSVSLGHISPGTHRINIPLDGLSNGSYRLQLYSGEQAASRPIILIKSGY